MHECLQRVRLGVIPRSVSVKSCDSVRLEVGALCDAPRVPIIVFVALGIQRVPRGIKLAERWCQGCRGGERTRKVPGGVIKDIKLAMTSASQKLGFERCIRRRSWRGRSTCSLTTTMTRRGSGRDVPTEYTIQSSFSCSCDSPQTHFPPSPSAPIRSSSCGQENAGKKKSPPKVKKRVRANDTLLVV